MMSVRRLEEGDIPTVLRISLAELGSDYLSEDDFTDAMEDGDQFCNVAVMDGSVVGFAICRMFGPGSEPEVLGLPDGPERDAVLSTDRIGILDSVAVDGPAKGHGAGSAVCSACVDEMAAAGCGMVCAMAWRSTTGRTNIAGILRGLGLTETVAIQGYWNRMVDSPGGHDCPECGAPCRCYGVFWYRILP